MPVSGALTVGAAAGSAALGGIKAILGGSDIAKAKKEMAGLTTPFYKIQDEYNQNRNIAANQAQQGFSSAEKNYAQQERERGLSSSIDATLRGGGDVNNLAGLLDNYNASVGNFAAQDAERHAANIDEFIKRNTELAGQKTMQWALNEYQPYENKLKQLQERIAAGKQNLLGGASDFLGGVAATGQALQNNDLNNQMMSYFKNLSTENNSSANNGVNVQQIMSGFPTLNNQVNQPETLNPPSKNWEDLSPEDQQSILTAIKGIF